ncbi:MAG: hypothetical protein R3C17_10585 [Planctomycetaceae bacterium]
MLAHHNNVGAGVLGVVKLRLNSNEYTHATTYNPFTDTPTWYEYKFSGLAEDTTACTPEISVQMGGTDSGTLSRVDAIYVEVFYSYVPVGGVSAGGSVEPDGTKDLQCIGANRAAAQSNVIADLNLITNIDSTSDGQSSTTAYLSTLVSLSATSAGQSDCTSSTGTAITIFASSDGQSDSTAAIGVQQKLVAQSTAQSAIVAPLSKETNITGSTAGQSSAVALLSAVRYLEATSDTTASVDSTLNNRRQITGSSAGQSAAAVALNPQWGLIANPAAISAATGVLSPQRGLSATSTGVSNLSFSLLNHEAIELTATSSGQSAATANLGFICSVSAESAAESDTTAGLNRRTNFAASVSGESETESVTVDVTKNMQAISAGIVTLTADCDITKSYVYLQSSIAAASDTTAELNRRTNFAATATGQSAVTAAPYYIRGLSAISSCISSVELQPGAIWALEALIASQSACKSVMIYNPKSISYELSKYLQSQINIDFYPCVLPLNRSLPAVSYTRDFTEYQYYLNNKTSDLVTTNLTLDIWCKTIAEAITISDNIATAIHGFTGEMGSVKITFLSIDNVSDSEFFDDSNSQGVIRSVEITIVHSIDNLSWTPYNYTSESDLRTYLQNLTGATVNFNPDIIDDRPLISISRTGPGYEQYLVGNYNTKSDEFSLTVTSNKYKEAIELSELIRKSLGNIVENSSDNFELDSGNKPIFRVDLDLAT